jgi:3-methyladenine DNA glycosylase AlkD
MKTLFILLIAALPFTAIAEDTGQSKRSKSDWYAHLDQRLNTLEDQFSADMALVHKKQEALNTEMVRLNEKLENRFDKYFLWGYGTLLVVISTLTNVIFNRKKRDAKVEQALDVEMKQS